MHSWCSLKFATKAKKQKLTNALEEYGKVCNYFINYFWKHGTIENFAIKKDLVSKPKLTWLSYRLKKVAAKEAMEMVKAVRER